MNYKQARRQRLRQSITGAHIILGLMIVWMGVGSVASIRTGIFLIYILMVSTVVFLIRANEYRNTRKWYLTHKSTLIYIALTTLILLFGSLYVSYDHVVFDNFMSLWLPALLLLAYIVAMSFSADALGDTRAQSSRGKAVTQVRVQLSLCINLGIFAYNAIVTGVLSSDTDSFLYAAGLLSVLVLSGVAVVSNIVFCFKINGWVSRVIHAGLTVLWLWSAGWTLLAIAFIGYQW